MKADHSPHTSRPDLTGDLSIAKPDWETFAINTADLITTEQTPARLLEVRGKLYELLVHAIPARLIIKTITDQLVRRVDENLRAHIVQKAAFYVSLHGCCPPVLVSHASPCHRRSAAARATRPCALLPCRQHCA